mmetsp:Transcript_81425/g.220613  ORF Transcript_81425/g.220613 Transcript_81425/m.220613 type:complete len:88 (+) Transcript_81425:257-520(+)
MPLARDLSLRLGKWKLAEKEAASEAAREARMRASLSERRRGENMKEEGGRSEERDGGGRRIGQKSALRNAHDCLRSSTIRSNPLPHM